MATVFSRTAMQTLMNTPRFIVAAQAYNLSGDQVEIRLAVEGDDRCFRS